PRRGRRPSPTRRQPPAAAGSERDSTAVRPQSVPGSLHRLDRAAPERTVDLLPQVTDVHRDHVRAVLVADVPGVLEQVEPGDDLTWTTHEELEQGVLLGGQ